MSIRVWGSVPRLLVVLPFLLSVAFSCAGIADASETQSTPVTGSDTVFTRAHRVVSTASPAAQAAFDDGLTLLYAFNPEEARVSFRHALDADPHLAIAWWGIATSYGVNINTAFDPASQRLGRDAIAKARALDAPATPAERALIDAAVKRFAFDRAADEYRAATAYRDAMYAAASDLPNDDDVQTLAAEAEMDVHPWSYFNRDGTPTAGTAGIVSRLQAVLARDPAHIGANHLLIHALEESPHPEGALAAAERLDADRFEPAAEHLTHMPGHTFMRVGMYHEAGDANARAVDAYRTYLASSPAGHTDYFGHDCVFGVDAFTMSGEYARARSLALACNEGRGGLLAVVDMRFGRYDALAHDEHTGELASGMLAVHDGRDRDAEIQLANLKKDRDDVGVISADVLEAAISARRGDRDSEIAALERAANVQDREGYSEPPLFWKPMREALGAAYYRAGKYDAAERAFRAALNTERDDPRALFGLARTLEREGRTADANAIDVRFANAWRQADCELDMKDL